MRQAGILLHLSSVPSPWGIGDFGPEALEFATKLKRCGMKVWQILPLTETSPLFGNSPYSPLSAFSGDPVFISPELMAQDGWISRSQLPKTLSEQKVNYQRVRELKGRILRSAWRNIKNREKEVISFVNFCDRNSYWLDDYAAFFVLKEIFSGKAWNTWPDPYRLRDPETIGSFVERAKDEIDFLKFKQFIFFEQQRNFRKSCNELGITILGDLPIYVTYDSPDVWSHPDLFQLDEAQEPGAVAGVPPDYYSVEGQLWGNPLYNWDKHEKNNFSWWMSRLEQALKLYDKVRIDHFSGLINYWSVPIGSKSAKIGSWQKTPEKAFFSILKKSFPELPFLAENLGVTNQDVRDMMKELLLPGMIVLQFAFDKKDGNSPYLPHNHSRLNTVYPGTHDNDTIRGWFINSPHRIHLNLTNYAGHRIDEHNVTDVLIRMALKSVAQLAIIPMQDFLDLGSEARMNTPSTSRGNWIWKFSSEDFSESLVRRITTLLKIYGRFQE